MRSVVAVLIGVFVLSSGLPSRQQQLTAAVSTSLELVESCRQQRLDGDLTSFLASVTCGNSQIRTAFVATGYPHMDLIDRWLSYREAVAGRADSGEFGEAEANEILATLTGRITTESMHAVHPTCRYDNHLSPMPVAQRRTLLETLVELPLVIG